MIVVIILFCLLLLLGFAEKYFHARFLHQIPLRILVNGTRGKTTVTRMVASLLNEQGIKTYAKTTGSDAKRIFPDGSERSYRKRKFPTMMEQLPFVRLAAKNQAQAIVVECMALRPENQFMMADTFIEPHYVLMTNAYIDHIEEIGATQEETVQTLALSIPSSATVITGEKAFKPYGSRVLLPQEPVDIRDFSDADYPIFEENLQLVFTLAKEMNIAHDTVVQGILHAKPDIGMIEHFTLGACTLTNAFAVNDPENFFKLLTLLGEKAPYCLLFNHRQDRGYRLKAFSKVLKSAPSPPLCIGVIGENSVWAAKYLTKTTALPAASLSSAMDWIQAVQEKGIQQILLCGNIKGEGRLLLEMLLRENKTNV
ncbi:MAG: poly-gamma-glutamate synthase PgsB [Clostridiales bacterium]|nr:poly-gamma-glutamate synthase PgsB [Clostridiales bacterium]